MTQLTVTPDILETPSLREHIDQSLENIETVLPVGASLILHIKKISKHLFGAHFRVRLCGREVVVRAYDDNVFRALNRGRRGLLRQIGDVRSQHRDETRPRRAR